MATQADKDLIIRLIVEEATSSTGDTSVLSDLLDSLRDAQIDTILASLKTNFNAKIDAEKSRIEQRRVT